MRMLARHRAIDRIVFGKSQIVAARESFGFVDVGEAADIGTRLEERNLRFVGRSGGHHQSGGLACARSFFGRGSDVFSQHLDTQPVFVAASGLLGRANLHAQVFGKAADLFGQTLSNFFVEESAEKITLENGALIRRGADLNAHHIVRKKRLPARALNLLFHLIQHRDANLGHFGRFAHQLRGASKRRFEYRSPQALDQLRDFHFNSPNSAAASTISRAIGAAVVPPYPPCSTTTANAMLFVRSPSYGANPANQECGMPSSNCAVPVFPATLTASPCIARRAVPCTTTERIALARNAARSGARICFGAALRALLESSTQRPSGIEPLAAMVAATRAILNGVTNTGPCP